MALIILIAALVILLALALTEMMSCQVPGAHRVLLSEGQGRREGDFTKHILFHLA